MNHFKMHRQLPFAVLTISGLYACPLAAQEDFYEEPTAVMHELRDWTISASPTYAYHPNGFPRVVGGLNSMVLLGKYFSLNANMAAGPGYIHFGSGIIGIPAIIMGGGDIIFADLEFEAFIIWAALLALAFENFNIHIPLTSILELSPYISLLRFKYIKEGYGGQGFDWNVNIVGGVRLNIFMTDRFFIAPFVEAIRDWGQRGRGFWGVAGGIHAGFYFRKN